MGKVTFLNDIRAVSTPGHYRAMIKFENFDIAAERVLTVDRNIGMALQTVTAVQATRGIVVPFEYANRNDLLVVILDDHRTYNASCLDGVKPELVKQNLVSTL